MSKRYLIKVIPSSGYTIYRFHVRRVHVVALVAVVLVALAGAVGVHAMQLRAAHERLVQLQAQEAKQRAALSSIDAQAANLSTKLQRIERQNQEIRRAMGIDRGNRRDTLEHRGPTARTNVRRGTESADVVARRLQRLADAEAAAQRETQRLTSLSHRILNMRRLEAIARAAMIARIPSILPAGDGNIASAFGYRTIPYSEFHQGVDLEADYGSVVRAAASGTVVFTGWDGGFGNKVDIDHGNGYHTWYAHLSAFIVHPGETVTKGQPIARVGATGAATGPHLHYQVMHDGAAIDPQPFLNGVPKNLVTALAPEKAP